MEVCFSALEVYFSGGEVQKRRISIRERGRPAGFFTFLWGRPLLYIWYSERSRHLK